jgi:hypothetical protein
LENCTEDGTMPRVQRQQRARGVIGFSIGNFVPAVVLGVGLYALPVRFWAVDVFVITAVAAAVAGSAVALARPELSLRALKVAALSLLAIGLLLVGAAASSAAFLSGVHGDYGRGGTLLMLLIVFLMVPYTLVYPVLELLWLHAKQKSLA